MTDPTTTTDVIVAIGSGVTATMALLTGIVAVVSLLGVRRDSRQRSRPVMTARFQSAVLSHGTIELIIENSGASTARDVTISFDPQLPDTGATAPFMIRRFGRTIAVVSAGEQLLNVYGQLLDGGKPGEFDQDLPTVVEVQMSYVDDNCRQYSDSFRLDAAVLADTTRTSRDIPTEAAKLKLQAEALEAIARAIGRV